MKRRKVSKPDVLNDPFVQFNNALKQIVSPEAKKAVDEDKKKRKAKKKPSASRASRDKD